MPRRIRNVAVPVLDGVFAFELGVLCEVFGSPRPDDPTLPDFDFALCTETPGPVRTRSGFDLVVRRRLLPARRGRPGRRPGDQPRGAGARAAARGAAPGRRPRRPGHERLQRRLHPRRGRPARRARVHDALDPRRRAGRALPGGPGQRRRALRRQRRRPDQRGHRGRDRRQPLPDPPRVRHHRRQRAGPPDGDAAAPRGRPAAVRRPAGALRGRHPLGHPASGCSSTWPRT